MIIYYHRVSFASQLRKVKVPTYLLLFLFLSNPNHPRLTLLLLPTPRSSLVLCLILFLLIGLCLGLVWFMGYSDFVTLFFAIIVWCTAYVTVALLASLRAVNHLCTS